MKHKKEQYFYYAGRGKRATHYMKWCKKNGYSEIADDVQQLKSRVLNKKKGKLHVLINTEIKPNFVNDKRKFYREEYLKSDHWKELRMRKICSHPSCEKCSETLHLDVHHLNYKNLYDVELDDLQVLCRSCHIKEHTHEENKLQNKRILVENVKTINPIERPRKGDQISYGKSKKEQLWTKKSLAKEVRQKWSSRNQSDEEKKRLENKKLTSTERRLKARLKKREYKKRKRLKESHVAD